MLRITIVYRYFWPEAMLPNDIADWLAAAGHDVEVITAQPSYNPEAGLAKRPWRETRNGVKIRRVPLLPERGRGLARLVNGGLFVLLASALVLFGRTRDVVWTTSIPPVVQPFLLRVASRLRGAKFVYFLQDIYPELGLAMNMLKDGAVAGLLRAVDTWTLSRADAVVTLSRDMADVVRERGARPKQLRVINNFAAVARHTPPRARGRAPARFVFAGNVGRFQNLERLVEVFAAIDPQTAVLEILGEGRVKAELMAAVRERGIRSVRFHDSLPVEQAFDFISGCDVGVVTLRPGLFRSAYPSKTFTYLSAGLPILVLVERASELAEVTEDRRLGRALEWGESDARIADAVRELASWTETADEIRDRSRDLYDPAVAREKWLALFSDLQGAKGGRPAGNRGSAASGRAADMHHGGT